MQTESKFELVSDERGKTWTLARCHTVHTRFCKDVFVPKGFVHDRYTWAPNLPDEKPAVVHDFCYITQRFADCTSMTRKEADTILRDLMLKSEDPTTRKMANVYYRVVRAAGFIPWWKETFRIWTRG